jgi:hypothetical protein
MPFVSLVPFEDIDPAFQEIMRTYDREYGGSEFLRAFAHAPQVSNRSSSPISPSFSRPAAPSI